MQTAQEFMESYLRENAALDELCGTYHKVIKQKYFSKDNQKYYLDWCAFVQANPETITKADVSGDTARIYTMQVFPKKPNRYRYNLRVSDGQWEIHNKESECFLCKGVERKGQNVCKFCGGAGWRDYTRSLGNEI